MLTRTLFLSLPLLLRLSLSLSLSVSCLKHCPTYFCISNSICIPWWPVVFEGGGLRPCFRSPSGFYLCGLQLHRGWARIFLLSVIRIWVRLGGQLLRNSLFCSAADVALQCFCCQSVSPLQTCAVWCSACNGRHHAFLPLVCQVLLWYCWCPNFALPQGTERSLDSVHVCAATFLWSRVKCFWEI